jgi:hypothetical protein
MKCILENKEAVTDLITLAGNALSSSKVNVRHQRLKALFAQQAGYNTEAAMYAALPITFDIDAFCVPFLNFCNTKLADKAPNPDFSGQCLRRDMIKTVEVTYKQCLEILGKLDEPEVFSDNGWGDTTTLSISVVNDGDGQYPYCFINRAQLKQLKDDGLLSDNVLQTYKARKLYLFDKKAYKRLLETASA